MMVSNRASIGDLVLQLVSTLMQRQQFFRSTDDDILDACFMPPMKPYRKVQPQWSWTHTSGVGADVSYVKPRSSKRRNTVGNESRGLTIILLQRF